MSQFWISEDMSIQVETLESALDNALKRKAAHLGVHIKRCENGGVGFKACGIEYKVTGNQVYPADPAFPYPDEPFVVLDRSGKDAHIFKLAEFSDYINLLEKLRRAVEAKNANEQEQLLAALHEVDMELGMDEDEEDGEYPEDEDENE